MPPRRGDGTPLSQAVNRDPDRSGFESPLEQAQANPLSQQEPYTTLMTLEENAAGVSPGGLIRHDGSDPAKVLLGPTGYLAESRTEARYSLGLLLAAVCLGQVSPWLAWAAWFCDDMEYVPSSISEMVHRAGSEERDLFVGMALSGILMICSGFSSRLSNVRAAHSKVSAFVDGWRYVGVGLGACIVSFVPAREKDAEESVRSSAHLLGAMLLFLSGLVTEGYTMWQDHPHLSHPDNRVERRSRQGLAFLAGLFVFIFLLFSLIPDKNIGLRGWVYHSCELGAEVIAGGLLLMLHFAFWVFAPERKAMHVPKTAFALWTITACVMSVFFVFTGLHFHRVATFAPVLAAKRDNCLEVHEYRCLKCKPGTKYGPPLKNGARECVEISDDSMYWGQLLLPKLADEFEKCAKQAETNYCGQHGKALANGKKPPLSDVITFTNDEEEALKAKFLSYHVCVDGLKFRGIYVPDILRLDLPELAYMSKEPEDPIMHLPERQRSVMTPACRFNDKSDEEADRLTGKEIQDMVKEFKSGQKTSFSSKGFTCIVSSLEIVNGAHADHRSGNIDVVSDSLWRMHIALMQIPGQSKATLSVTPTTREAPGSPTGNQTAPDVGFSKDLPIPTVADLPRAMRTCRVKPYGLDDRGLIINAGIGGLKCSDSLLAGNRLTVDDVRCDRRETGRDPWCDGPGLATALGASSAPGAPGMSAAPSASPVGQGLLERPTPRAEPAPGGPRVSVEATSDNRVLVEIRPAGYDKDKADHAAWSRSEGGE